MAKFCPKCGSSLNEGAKFCGSCGSQFQAEPPVAPEPMPAAPPTQPVQPAPPPPPQAVGQPPMPGYAAPPPKKSSGKIIGAVIAVIAIVVVIVIAFFLLTGGLPGIGGGDSRFVGTWRSEEIMGFTYDMKFLSNGDLEFGSEGYTMKVGTWSVNGDQLCFEVDPSFAAYTEVSTECIQYQFSDSNTLVLITDGSVQTTYTKV